MTHVLRGPFRSFGATFAIALILYATSGCAGHPVATPSRTRTTSPMPATTGSLPDTASVLTELDARVRPLVEGRWVAGAMIGLISDERGSVRGYGRIHDGGPPPDENTEFEIGPVTRSFTALLYADSLARRELTIESSVQSLLPAGVVAPSAEGRPLLLFDLATHRSGLAPIAALMRPADPSNPFANFHDEQLVAAIRDTTLSDTPGTRYETSDFGYGLLGWLLARRANAPFAQLLADRVTRPLGMLDTTIVLTAAQRARLAQGHDAHGDVAGRWDFDALAGAGAVHSTMHDMLRFVRANILPTGPLADAIVRTHVLRAEIEDHSGFVTIGWSAWRDRKTLWNSGETGGYYAFVGFRPRHRIGVVVLANSASPQINEIGLAALRLLGGQSAPAPTLPSAAVRAR